MTNPTTNTRLEGNSTIVFGGSSGIGAAIARRLAASGHRVTAASRRGTSPQSDGITAARCDIRDVDAVARALSEADTGDGISWVVNAAGVGFYAPVESGFEQQWRDILDTNVLGMLNILSCMSNLACPVRHFVHIGSLAGSRPSQTPGNDVYSASKAACAIMLARHRAHLRLRDIRTKITLVTPGFVADTDFSRNYFNHIPQMQQSLLDRFPPLSPDDIADTVAHALHQPNHIELSEIVIRPVDQPD